jgi:nicotinate-nucleotide pyrophosphorylase (carboxylating)
MVMLKDNHIWSAGSITNAVKKARTAAGFSQKIEVECQTLEEAMQAAEAGADIVMLDNFEPSLLKSAAETFKAKFPSVLVEASGGITTETMPEYLSENVDIVSQGRLTQGYSCLDYSLKILQDT